MIDFPPGVYTKSPVYTISGKDGCTAAGMGLRLKAFSSQPSDYPITDVMGEILSPFDIFCIKKGEFSFINRLLLEE